MYCPVGWPRVLVGRGGDNGGDPVQLLRHRTKNLVVEVRERSVRVWHSRVRELVGSRTRSLLDGSFTVLFLGSQLHLVLASYTLSQKDVTRTGVNVRAVVKPDGSRMVLAVSSVFVPVHDAIKNRSY